MRKHLLFIFIFSLFIVSVMGQGFNTSTPAVTTIGNQSYYVPSFSLSEAYPNPADLETKLNYSIAREITDAKIIIRSLLGLNVSETLIEQSTGTITIQTNELPSGIYFYSLLLNGDIVITRKLVIRH